MLKTVAIALLLLSAIARADVEMQYSDGSMGLVDDGRVLFGDEDAAVLFIPGEEGMVVISHEERTWVRLKPGFANAMVSQVQAQMEAMLAGMPPEQRAMVEQQMSGMMPQMQGEPPKMSIRKTGNTEEIAGYDCAEVEIVSADGTVEESVCVATADELGIDDDDFEAMLRAMEGMAEVATLGGGGRAQLEFAKLGGVPIRTRAPNDRDNNEIVRIDTSDVDSTRLQIPDEYRETSFEEMMQ